MNRFKLWVYVVLAVTAGALFFRSSSNDAVTRAGAGVDRRLSLAGEAAAAALRAVDGQAAAIAAVVARDPGVRTATAVAAEPLTPPRGKRPAMPPPADEATREQDRLAAARSAAVAAAAAIGLPSDVRVEVWIAAEADFAEGAKGDATIWDLLRGAASGKARAGRIVVDELAWTVATAPTGDGGAVAVALPIDFAWVGALSAATGVDVTVAVPGAKTVTTVRAEEAKAIADAGARSPRSLADSGRLAPVPLTLPLPLPLPAVPLLFGAAPAQRVLALPLEGLKSAELVLSAATRPDLVPLVREQWTAVAGLAVLLLVGLMFGFLVRGEVAAQLPGDLVSAASRIEKGEFAARAPALAGKLGTIAAALNAAADAAERAAAAPAPLAPAASVEPSAFDFPRAAVAAAAAPAAADPFAPAPAFPAEPEFVAPSAPSAAAERPDASGLFGGAFEAAPIRAPAPASEPSSAQLTTPADLLMGAARTAVPEAAAASDDDHWRQVFDDFLRVRRECGEAAEGLTYERFRSKLEKNRDQLVTKYACKSVRFQVYVKEGKAALKATPVR
jgi:hypothetical protein